MMLKEISFQFAVVVVRRFKIQLRFSFNEIRRSNGNPVRTEFSIKQFSKVEEKFGEQNVRSFSEMRILAKIWVVILDLVG